MRLPQRGSISLALALAAAIGFFDYVTGYDLNVRPFYLIPICWAVWVAGSGVGLCLAIVCAVLWLVADRMSGHIYHYTAMPYWNALMLLVFFTAVVYLLSGLQRRSQALKAEILKRERLEAANLHAERLAMVGTMAALVAHEVRNPLGSITLNLDLLAKQMEKAAGATRQPAEEALVLVNEIRAEVSRIRNVIEDYLRFARLRKPQRKPLSLNQFLEQNLALMGAAFENCGVRLQTNLDPGAGTIHADADQLWQALVNLVRNSLEAMPGGGVLTVSTHRHNQEALVSLADTGKGMKEEHLKQVFTPFFTTKPQGTGLGLPLTEQILSEHGARIECASTLGNGTTFTIHFPPERNS
ncbi:MAG: two-component system sensor histidine kinase NtrB [Limisphaerales bacterium]